MLRLHGFPASNYYNIARLALLEKQLPFEEVVVYTGANADYRPDYLDMSPLGRVPCLQTEQGFISESRCIVDYLEDAHPERPLYPQEPFARAKLRELTQIIDLDLELQSRRVLKNFFARSEPPAAVAQEVADNTRKGAKAVAKLASFDAFLLGDTFTAADIAGVIHFPIVRMMCQGVLKMDPFEGIEGLDAYLARMEERETVKQIRDATAKNFPEFIAHIQKHYSA